MMSIDQIVADPDAFCDTLMDSRPQWVAGSLSHFDSRFLFRSALAAQTGEIVEIGTASGFSTTVLCYALNTAYRTGKIGRDFRLISYDICPFFYADPGKKVGDAAREQLPRELLDHVVFRNPATVLDLPQHHAPDSIYFLFIDANHRHPWPTLDLLGSLDLLCPGALVALHDISLPVIHPQFNDFGVKCLFDELDLNNQTSIDPTGPANTGSITIPKDKKRLRNKLLKILYKQEWQDPVDQSYLDKLGVPSRKAI